jgi:BirA family biotin operon repressor/biotin-[acetyl-CoA-carboxylase] ligase
LETNVNNTFFTGKFLLHLPSVDSTNNYAKQHLAKSSPIDGTVILADEQFAGRGQAGNVWQSEPNKNLTFSIIYQTSFLQATEQFYLSMAVSLGIKHAIHSIIQKFSNSITKIKWPNDIYVGNKKIAGILIENTISGMHLKDSVIGIGLNVNQENFPEEINATSLKVLLKNEMKKTEILNEILVFVEKYFLLLKERKFERIKKEYLENIFRYNETAFFKKEEQIFEGKITDVDVTGNLIIETQNGSGSSERKFGFKEISFITDYV